MIESLGAIYDWIALWVRSDDSKEELEEGVKLQNLFIETANIEMSVNLQFKQA